MDAREQRALAVHALGADPEIRADNGWAMGNQPARFLNRAKAGSDVYKKLSEIKETLIQHGGKWPPAPVK